MPSLQDKCLPHCFMTPAPKVSPQADLTVSIVCLVSFPFVWAWFGDHTWQGSEDTHGSVLRGSYHQCVRNAFGSRAKTMDSCIQCLCSDPLKHLGRIFPLLNLNEIGAGRVSLAHGQPWVQSPAFHEDSQALPGVIAKSVIPKQINKQTSKILMK